MAASKCCMTKFVDRIDLGVQDAPASNLIITESPKDASSGNSDAATKLKMSTNHGMGIRSIVRDNPACPKDERTFYTNAGFGRERKCKLGTEKPKVARGDRLDYQRTLVGLILSVLARSGEPSPFDHGDRHRRRSHRIQALSLYSVPLIKSETKSVQLCCICLYFAETESDKSLSRLFQPSLCRARVSTFHSRVLLWCINRGVSNIHSWSQLRHELESGLIHLLPKFHGLAREDPHKHLKEFNVVYSTMRPHGISEDYIKMKAFPFSLDGAVKAWLYM
ncbi:hypothetical protein CR513_10076, partial [Mucuna pruriens]